jgi:phage major head subunit gpT-like protein
MALRSQFGDLLEPGFREIFYDRYEETPSVMASVFHVNTSTKQDEKDSAVTGFGLLSLTGEGDPITYEDPIQMYDKTYVHLKYTKGFKISRELYDDDQYNVMNKKPAALGRAARRTVENEAAQVFNRAFNTSYLGGDTKPLASTTHPRADAGTAQSNASATGITLTEENLETGRLAVRNQLDDKGMKIDANANTLLVPINLGKTAGLIVNSEKRQGTADNDLNFYRGMYKIVEWIYLSSTTAWFLIDSGLHEVNWFWRDKPEFKQDETFDTDMALYKVRTRFSRGWSDWRGVWGSKGDGQAYSS